jgi:hypothetical protein
VKKIITIGFGTVMGPLVIVFLRALKASENSSQFVLDMFLYLTAGPDYLNQLTIREESSINHVTLIYYICVAAIVMYTLLLGRSNKLKLLALSTVIIVHTTLFYLGIDRYAHNIGEAFGRLLD